MVKDTEMPEASGRWGFIGQPIRVATEGETAEPVSFSWREKQYRIEKILVSWFDWGFPAGAKQRNWKSRRHRRYYRVATDTGEVYEIYHDRRSPGQAGDWMCYQQWIVDSSQ